MKMQPRKASGSKPQAGKTRMSSLQRWNDLDSRREVMMRRFEQYAQTTIPKVLLPKEKNEYYESLQLDFQSVGAQAVNHLTNKVMMALFPMGQPFFRLDPDDKLMAQLSENGVTEEQVREGLISGETKAIQVLDQKALRPHLFTVIRHLIVVGNVLLDLDDEEHPRVINLRDYVVKRNLNGEDQEILHHEQVLWDELTDEAQKIVPPRHGEDGYVHYIRHFCRTAKGWHMKIEVDGICLGPDFEKTWTSEKFAVYPLCWDRADKHNYGTGLVEEYSGDFSTLSTLTEAEIQAAVLASDFRWLSDPAGVNDIAEFKNSRTGDVIPGRQGDLTLVAHVGAGNLQAIAGSADRVINRIGRGFLLGSAMTRQAERVTAEEIRLNAIELETSLGGVYSRLAVDMQLPIAKWLLRYNGAGIEGTDLIPTVVTGLAALSRGGEAQQLGSFLATLNSIGTLTPLVLERLKLSSVISTLAGAYGIVPSKFVLSEEEFGQKMQAQQQAQQEQEAASAMTEAAGKRLSEPPPQE